jgi:hypothetical protein
MGREKPHHVIDFSRLAVVNYRITSNVGVCLSRGFRQAAKCFRPYGEEPEARADEAADGIAVREMPHGVGPPADFIVDHSDGFWGRT